MAEKRSKYIEEPYEAPKKKPVKKKKKTSLFGTKKKPVKNSAHVAKKSKPTGERTPKKSQPDYNLDLGYDFDLEQIPNSDLYGFSDDFSQSYYVSTENNYDFLSNDGYYEVGSVTDDFSSQSDASPFIDEQPENWENISPYYYKEEPKAREKRARKSTSSPIEEEEPKPRIKKSRKQEAPVLTETKQRTKNKKDKEIPSLDGEKPKGRVKRSIKADTPSSGKSKTQSSVIKEEMPKIGRKEQLESQPDEYWDYTPKAPKNKQLATIEPEVRTPILAQDEYDYSITQEEPTNIPEAETPPHLPIEHNSENEKPVAETEYSEYNNVLKAPADFDDINLLETTKYEDYFLNISEEGYSEENSMPMLKPLPEQLQKKPERSAPSKSSASVKKKKAAAKKKKKKKRASKGKIWLSRIIFLVLLGLIIGGGYYKGKQDLDSLELKLIDYEKSQNYQFMDSYMQTLTDEKWQQLLAPTLDMVDTNLQTREDCFNYIKGIIGTDLRYAKTPENELVYAIYNNDMTVLEVTLHKDETGEYPVYSVASESCDFSYIFHSAEITAPSVYTVKLGGRTVPDSYITEDNVEYEYLKHMYRISSPLPCMRTYTVNNIFGGEELKIYDLAGNETTAESVGDGRVLFGQVDEATAYDITRISTAFTNDMVYVSCGFGGSVSAYAAPGAEILQRASMLGTSAYYHTQGAYVTNFVVNGIYALGNNLYICDVSFHTQGHTYYSVADYDHNYKYLFDDSSGMMGIRIVQGYVK